MLESSTMHSLSTVLAFLTWKCLILTGIYASSDNVVTPSCPPEASICHFEFVVRYNLTMTTWRPEMNPVIVKEDGALYKVNSGCQEDVAVSKEEYDSFISGDGTFKKVILINGQLPAPPIVVYTGQQVSVRVSNKMLSEGTTLHWHGLLMRGTPWMDGAGHISQCPIQPGQSFHYRFIPQIAGTFWYHSHYGAQRSMGLAGHLTVLEKNPTIENNLRAPHKLPAFEHEFHLMVSDWSKQTTEGDYFSSQGAFYRHLDDLGTCYVTKTHVDRSPSIPPAFHSAIINGKGQVFDATLAETMHSVLPIETFTVNRGSFYKFRIVNSAMNFPFLISIDNHHLHIIASDGNDVVPTTVTHLVILPGETYDAYIEASDPKNLGSYWIRALNLDYFDGENKKLERVGLVKAILRYQGASNTPISQPHLCRPLNKCIYLNCISKFYPAEDNIECLPLTSLRQPTEEPTLLPSDGAGFTDLILAMDYRPPTGPVINGKQNVLPVVPPQIFPKDAGRVDCDSTCTNTDLCHCTHELMLPKDHIIQVTFFAHVPAKESSLGSFHPMHIHGTTFQVIKIGWGTYNSTTGEMTDPSSDIDCGNMPGDTCFSPVWANRRWKNGNIPGILKKSAPLKNTVLVPAGGYVVVRFKADNPGYWFLHCHMESHQMEGLTLTFKAGEDKDMPPLPENFPTCGGFEWSNEDFLEMVEKPQTRVVKNDGIDVQASGMISVSHAFSDIFAITVLGALLAIVCLAMVVVLIKAIASKIEHTEKYLKMGPSARYTSVPPHLKENAPLLDKN